MVGNLEGLTVSVFLPLLAASVYPVMIYPSIPSEPAPLHTCVLSAPVLVSTVAVGACAASKTISVPGLLKYGSISPRLLSSCIPL